MKKQMTPMQYLKDYFKELEELLGRPVELSKTNPKYDPYGGEQGLGQYTKGVGSDFIRIYKIKKSPSVFSKNSFAFAFNGLEGKTGTITITLKEIKNEKEKYHTKILKFEEFKEKLKYFIKTIKILKNSQENKLFITEDNIKKTINEIFDIRNSEKEIKEMIKEEEKRFKEELKRTKGRLMRTKNKFNSKTKNLEELENKLEKEVEELKEELGIKRLEEELKKKREKLNKAVKKQKEEITKLEREVGRMRYDLMRVEREYKEEINNYLKSKPPVVKKELEKKFNI